MTCVASLQDICGTANNTRHALQNALEPTPILWSTARHPIEAELMSKRRMPLRVQEKKSISSKTKRSTPNLGTFGPLTKFFLPFSLIQQARQGTTGHDRARQVTTGSPNSKHSNNEHSRRKGLRRRNGHLPLPLIPNNNPIVPVHLLSNDTTILI